MKIKNVYQKILRNMLKFNNNIAYKGDKVLKTRLGGSVLIETEVPDFIDIPIYSRNLEEILKLITDDTDVSVTCKDGIDYLLFSNSLGKIRFRMPKQKLVDESVSSKVTIDEFYNKCQNVLTFNLTQDKYKELIRVSGLIGSDTFIIQSVDDKKIRFITYNRSDKNDKQYAIEIEIDHEHFEGSYTFNLTYFNLIDAPDYKINLGYQERLSKNGLSRGVLKIEAFLTDNIIMKYLIIGNE